jgi:hypothetical protein
LLAVRQRLKLVTAQPTRRAAAARLRPRPGNRYQIFAITCPFALCNAAGRERVMTAYHAGPAAGVQALILEHIAVALNPRQGLAAGERLSSLLAASGQHHEVMAAFAAELDQMTWAVYDVRRVIRPSRSDPSKAANPARSLRAVARGSQAAMRTALRELAATQDAAIEADGGIERAWLRRRGAALPVVEHFLVAAPAGPHDKERPGFAAAWKAATAPAAGEPGCAVQLPLPLTWAATDK